MEDPMRLHMEDNARQVPEQFNPYMDNGGTVIAIATGNRVVVGGDTRLSMGYNVLARNFCKMTQLTSKCMIATSGMTTDAQALHKQLGARVTMYKHANGIEPDVYAIAQLLSNTLYYRRFFPFYTFNLLSGLDSNGQGVVFGYDAIGSYDAMKYGVQGSGKQLAVTVLDNQLTGRNQQITTQLKENEGARPDYIGDPVELIKDVLTSVAERDISTGDKVEVFDITAEGITRTEVLLRND